MQAEAEVIKQSVDIAELIESKGISLKKNGKSFVGLCPFHKDTKPSFTVTPKENLWHCFGCGKGGDVFSFLQELEKISFHEAVLQLKKKNGKSRRNPQMNSGQTATALSKKEQQAINHQEILNRVVEYYHETFYEDTRGILYLRDKRNIHDKEIFESFKAGFANGSIFKMLPESGEIPDMLKTIGILTETGKEFFHNCVVFPIYDEEGRVSEIYGRSVEEPCKTPHLYLKGPHRGVFNWQAAKRSRELILTESIIDALSIYQAGYRDVIPLYGVNGLTDCHISLFRKYAVKKIFFVFDNDSAGEDASRIISRALSFIECFKVTLPCKDANEFFNAHSSDGFQKLLDEAEIIRNYESEITEDGFTIEKDDVRYFVKVISSFESRLKVMLKALYRDKVYLDTIDLYSHRSRQSAVNQISKRFIIQKELIEAHFLSIISQSEKYDKEQMPKESQKEPAMSEDEKEEALRFLTSKDIVKEIIQDIDGLGYVGEDSNKLLAYLIGISRKLDRPLSGIISSSSGAGKSRLAEMIESLTPPEDVILFSRLSSQALGYMEKDFLKQKLLIIEERKGSEAADYSIRTLQSRRKLTQGIVIKDPSSGRMYTKTYTVEGPIAYLETTTDGMVNPENSTRCFEMYLDESNEQTKKVHDTQRLSRTVGGLLLCDQSETIRKKHQNAQRLLKPLKVVIPYAPLLTFPSGWLRTRRDNERFLCLIEAICFLHHHQREKKTLSENGNTIEYVEATVSDYRLAYDLAKEVLTHTLNDLKKNARELLEEICAMAVEKAALCKLEHYEVVFSRREIREYTKWSDWKVRDCIAQLVELEYLLTAGGSQGKQCIYQVSGLIPHNEFSLQGLTSPDNLEKKMLDNALKE